MINYIKEHKRFLICFFGVCLIFFTVFFLYSLPLEAVIYPVILSMVFIMIMFVCGYLNEKKKLLQLSEAEKRRELMDTCELPATTEVEKKYAELIALLLDENAAAAGKMQENYQELSRYYTLWVHQIKTPIASMRLKLSEADSDGARAILSDLKRIEQYVDMVMTYVRLGSGASDYVFRSCALDGIIRASVKKFSSDFIMKKLSLDYEETELSVLTDDKWLGFIIEQLLSNALKYTQKGKISIAAKKSGDGRAAELIISDTGIGISEENLPRIFEPGFTGMNGRIENNRASGIGLYLVKRVCDNMGIDITVDSEVGRGTSVCLRIKDEKLIYE